MGDNEDCQEKVRNIRADGTTLWWNFAEKFDRVSYSARVEEWVNTYFYHSLTFNWKFI